MEIKFKLISSGLTQEWLIAEVRKETEQYIDSSCLYKIMTGQIKESRLIPIIKKILEI
jgi:hypothetical protein